VPQLDDSHEQRDSEGGSSDGGENHRDSDGWSDREREEVADGGDDTNTMVGWAEAMAKILGKKTTESRSNILVKSKELDKMKAADREEQLKRKKQVMTSHSHRCVGFIGWCVGVAPIHAQRGPHYSTHLQSSATILSK